MAPKISIIVPFYNTEAFILDTLKDLQSQTFEDWECLLVDNASTDNTREVCEDFIKNDARFILLTEKTPGPSSARNKGIENARGEYFYFSDSDDRIHPKCLELALSAIGDADLLQFNFVPFEDRTTFGFNDVSEPPSVCEIRSPLDCLCAKIPICSLYSKLFSKRCFANLRFRKEIVRGEDRMFLYELIHNLSDLKMNTIDVALYYYYQRQGSIVHTPYNFSDIQDLENFLRGQAQLFSDMPQRLLQLKKNHFTILIKELCRLTKHSPLEIRSKATKMAKGLLRDKIIRYADFSLRWRIRLFRFVHSNS